jgi:hypothetical protein
MMEVTQSSIRVRVALALIPACAGAAIVFLFLTEWWPIAVNGDASLISEYHFGSETMMGIGGWRYANPEVYAWTAFAEALALGSITVLTWRAIVRRSRLSLVVIAFLVIAWWGTAAFLGQLNWATRATRLSRIPVSQDASSSVRAKPPDQSVTFTRQEATYEERGTS